MYFGVIDVKTNLWMLLNIILIILSSVIISGKVQTGAESILTSNGYSKQEVSGFTCYVKEVSSVRDNKHELTFVQLVPLSQIEQSSNLEYQIAIRVTCNDKQYFIFDKSIDDDHKYCTQCSMYLGNNLIKTFNAKNGVKLEEINTHAGRIYVAQLVTGISCLAFVLFILAATAYSIFKFVKTFEFTDIIYISRYKIALKGFAIFYVFIFILNIIILCI